MGTTHGQNLHDRVEMRRVTIVEVNLEHTSFPIAVGKDKRKVNGGLLYQINLSHGIGDTIVVPNTGEVWWITRQIGEWILHHRESVAEARSGGTPTPSPSGMVVAFAGDTAPFGWLVCDGSTVSRKAYSDLFAVLGTAYGAGDGVNTFVLPDLRGRFVLGWVGAEFEQQFADEGLKVPRDGLLLGETAGTRGWIDHSHPIPFTRYAGAGGGGGAIPNTRTEVQDHSSVRSESAQTDTSERHPYITLNFIIKT